MGDSAVELLFLGTGTSAGVPMIGCECEICTSRDPRDNRTRCSVVISYMAPSPGGSAALRRHPLPEGEGVAEPEIQLLPENVNRPAAAMMARESPEEALRTKVLVDTTPELRIQAITNGLRRIDAIVYTHAHADHVMGLDDVRRFNSVKRGPLDVWADAETHETLAGVFRYAFREPDPDSALYRPHLTMRLIDGPFEVGGRTWTPIPLLHGDARVLGFRIGALAYCTDASEVPGQSMELLRDLDVLVLDALQHRKHPTHLTVAEALGIVADLKPRRTYFTHMSHGILHARDEAKLPPNVFFAYDGLRVQS